jgi:hypothetical protein
VRSFDLQAIPNTGGQVSDWISHHDANTTSSHQLAFLTPGIMPSNAMFRKQMRQS